MNWSFKQGFAGCLLTHSLTTPLRPPRCPFLLNMDLIGIANRFAQFTLPAFALGTLLLIPCDMKKEKQIQVQYVLLPSHRRRGGGHTSHWLRNVGLCRQGFLSGCNPLAILEQVEELMNTGEMAGIPSQVTSPPSYACPLLLLWRIDQWFTNWAAIHNWITAGGQVGLGVIGRK